MTGISERQRRRALRAVNERPDPLAPARGIGFGCLLSLPLWLVIGASIGWLLTCT